jgi:uncharacterized protein
MKTRIHFITLGVKDIRKSRNFYEKILGFEPATRPKGDIVFFYANNKTLILALYPLKKLAEDAGLKKIAGTGFRGTTLSCNVATENEVDARIEFLKKKKVKILRKPEKAIWGGRTAYFADPDGNPWEIAWNPFVKFSKQGDLIF